MTAILTVQGVEKSFGPRRVLEGVSFAVHERDRIALVGVNGCGKTTLMRLLVGASEDEAPDAGIVTRKRDLTIEHVAQEPRLDPSRSVGETVREGLRAHAEALARLESIQATIQAQEGSALDAALSEQAALHARIAQLGGWDQEYEIRGLAAALELPPLDAAVGKLSIGERRRVAIARALLAQPDLLALDEPTNHLDAATTARLEERLVSHSGALLLVTHDRYFLDRVATRILELDRGQLYAYEGGYARFLEKQAERLGEEARREQERAAFVRRELDWIRRGPAARTTKQKARIDRFEAAVAARTQPGERPPSQVALKLPMATRLGKTILDLRGLTKRMGDKLLFSDLNMTWKPGDRVGVVGPNGAGKTTLVRTILGQVTPDEGTVLVGQNTSFAFLDQGREELRDDRTVLEEVAGDNDQVFLPHGPVHARTFLRMMLFDDGFADTPVGTLSGGERNRVQLAKLLRAGGNFLILDEPTNDLDLMTLGVLEEALASFPGCALIVSHDRWFLDRVATGILAFEGDGMTGFYEGNCSDYLAKERAGHQGTTDQGRAAASQGSRATPTPQAVRRPVRLSFKEKQELAGMEQAIMEAEARVADLEHALQDPSLYQSRGAEVPSLVEALDERRRDVERLYERWQALEAIERG
ncbi:MAG: ATP-binding cassette domain-containing protein [Deltaproteobacteria bacterium]|nr:ATP-binding cassette domain-containing protein [Deltaproteobacteria bacterium]